MTYKRLRIALVLLVLATGTSMAGPKDQWFTITRTGVTPPPEALMGLVSGGWENGRELYVCRAVIFNNIQPGKTWTGLNGCFVVSSNGETLVTPYQVLPQPPFVSDYNFTYRWATRTEIISNPGLWDLAVQGGIYLGSVNNPDTHICSRDLWLNGAYVGRHPGVLFDQPPFDTCYVTWGGQYYGGQDFNILLYSHD